MGYIAAAVVIVAAILALGMCGLVYLTERPAPVHYHDNRAVYMVLVGGPALRPRDHVGELEANTCETTTR